MQVRVKSSHFGMHPVCIRYRRCRVDTRGHTRSTPANGATVSLYNSQAEYGAGKPPAYNATTDANGNALFQKVTAGTYFIVAEKGDESNILKEQGFWSSTPVNYNNTLIYTGLAIQSIFQSQAEVTTSANQPNAAPGNFRYVDANGDGVINQWDFVPLAADSVVFSQVQDDSVILFISYSDNQMMKHH